MKLPRSYTYAVTLLFGAVVLLPIGQMAASVFRVEPGALAALPTDLFGGRQLGLARNSLYLACGAAGLSVAVGAPFAFLCARTDLKWRRFFGWLSMVPVLIPPYIHAIVWARMDGFLEKYLGFQIHSLPGAVMVLACAYFPFVVLMTLTGLKSIDRNLEEAALLNRGRLHTLCRITLPLVMPHVIAGAVFVFIFSAINVGVPDFLRVKAYPLEIFIQFSAFYDQAAATLLSLPLIAVTFLLVALQKRYMKGRSYVQVSVGARSHITLPLGWLQVPAQAFCSAVIGLCAVFPVFLLARTAGAPGIYLKVVDTSIHQIAYSFILAFSGSIVVLAVGFAVAYLIRWSGPRLSGLLSWAVLVPLAVPATTMGIGLIETWNRPGIDRVYGSSLIIVLGYVARFLPFAVIVLSSGLGQIGRQVEEAAFFSNTGLWRRLGTIVVPLSRQGICAVLFIIFILAFGELGTTLLVIPPGRETIPIKIYNLMHYGADQQVAALCLVVLATIFSASGVFLVLHRKMNRRSPHPLRGEEN